MPDTLQEPEDELGEELEEVHDLPWRDRVVARSLGAATRQTLDRADALIQATVELLQVSGESVTVQEVADRAGYSLRILYRHFSSKEDLLAAVLECQLEEGAARIGRLLEDVEEPVERLAEFIRLSTDHAPTPLNLALAKQENILLLSHPAEVVRAQRPMATLGSDLVQAAVEAGQIDPTIAKHGVYSMMALKRAYNRARLLGDDFGLLLPTSEEIVSDCLRGLGIDYPGERPKAVR